ARRARHGRPDRPPSGARRPPIRTRLALPVRRRAALDRDARPPDEPRARRTRGGSPRGLLPRPPRPPHLGDRARLIRLTPGRTHRRPAPRIPAARCRRPVCRLAAGCEPPRPVLTPPPPLRQKRGCRGLSVP